MKPLIQFLPHGTQSINTMVNNSSLVTVMVMITNQIYSRIFVQPGQALSRGRKNVRRPFLLAHTKSILLYMPPNLSPLDAHFHRLHAKVQTRSCYTTEPTLSPPGARLSAQESKGRSLWDCNLGLPFSRFSEPPRNGRSQQSRSPHVLSFLHHQLNSSLLRLTHDHP